MIRFFNVAIPGRMLTLFLVEVLVLSSCLIFGAWLDPDIPDLNTFVQFDSGIQRILIVTATILAGMFMRNLYSGVRISSRFALVEELCIVFGLSVIGQGMVDYAAPAWTLPRKVMVAGGLLALGLISGLRFAFDSVAGDDIATGKLLFLGRSATVDLLATSFEAHPEYGWSVLGYLSTNNPEENPERPASAGGPACLGTMQDLDQIVEEHHPHLIVIARRSDIRPSWTEEFLELRFGGVQAEEAGALYEKTLGRVCSAEIWPHKLIFSDAYDPRPIDTRLVAIFSVVAAAVCTVAVLPVMLLVALLVAATSRGPVIVRERRTGLNDVPFERLRFRTWREGGAPTFVGDFLRRFGLDGLPGLVNVLMGQMALVGPRAELPEYAAVLAGEIPFYRQRNRVRPGLTGWEQIHCREMKTETLQRLEYDLYYVKNLSVTLDIFVLLRALRDTMFGV